MPDGLHDVHGCSIQRFRCLYRAQLLPSCHATWGSRLIVAVCSCFLCSLMCLHMVLEGIDNRRNPLDYLEPLQRQSATHCEWRFICAHVHGVICAGAVQCECHYSAMCDHVHAKVVQSVIMAFGSCAICDHECAEIVPCVPMLCHVSFNCFEYCPH